MVQVTERASVELRRLLTEYFARPQQGVRLRLNEAGGLRMTIDIPHAGDSVIRRDNVPVLIVDARLALTLAQRVLDFGANRDGGQGFTLGWRTQRQPGTAEKEVAHVQEGRQQDESKSENPDGQ
jgi:Fe-S cluster assembly iron-binding protein IscA